MIEVQHEVLIFLFSDRDDETRPGFQYDQPQGLHGGDFGTGHPVMSVVTFFHSLKNRLNHI